jgi:hypothetical protein
MVGTVHAVDEALLVLTRERDDARWWAKVAIDEIIEERDEARRAVCYAEVNGQYGRRYTPQGIALERGWNCFKETP